MSKQEAITQLVSVLNAWLIKRVIIEHEPFNGTVKIRVRASFEGWHGAYGSAK